MSQGNNSQFNQILTAAKERKGDMAIDTMIVSSHLAQMRMFMLRRGIEFYAEQDSFGKAQRVFGPGVRIEHAGHEARFNC